MNETRKVTEEWYVVFTGSTLRHWLMRFLHPDFRHVKMVKEDQGIWIIVDSCNSYTKISTELVEDYPYIRLLCPNSVILPVRVNIDADKYQWHLGINSCVDIAKGIMGIRNIAICTPYQLYKYLRGKPNG